MKLSEQIFAVPIRNKALLVVLWLVITGFALAQIFRMESIAKNPERAIDFRNIYIGSSLILSGKNPYNDANIKNCWVQIRGKEKLPENMTPGLPSMALLYPPMALYSAIPFTKLTYSNSVLLFRIFLFLQCFLIPFLLSKWLRNRGVSFGALPLFLLFISLKPTLKMIEVGQPSLVLFTVVLFMANGLTAKNSVGIRGHLLFFLGTLKPTIGITTLAFYTASWKKMWIPLFLIIMAFSAFFWMESGSWEGYLSQANGQVSAAYDSSDPDFPFTFEAMGNTQIDSLLALVAIPVSFHWVFKILLFVLSGAALLRIGRKFDPQAHWLIFIVFSLVFTYHKYYDLLLLLPFLLLFTFMGRRWMAVLSILSLLHLLIPYKSLAVIGFPDTIINVLQFMNALLPLFWLLAILIGGQEIDRKICSSAGNKWQSVDVQPKA